MLGIIGLLGGLCFAFAAVPSAIKTIKAGKSLGTPIDIALMILGGTVLIYAYLYLKFGFDLILTINYAVEALSWLIIVAYHFKGRS